MIGRAERIDALSAAFLNAAAANVHDFCDTHLATVIHPTAPVAPALLALAELRAVSGPDLLLAFILGNEVQARIGLAISPHHYDKGWHITSTCGVFGAAAGSGKLLGLDAHQVGLRARHRVHAIRRPLRMPGLACQERQRRQCRAQRACGRRLLAAKGFGGPAEPLAGRQGFYNAMGDTPDLARVTSGLGETWELMATSYKPYPCGFVIHPVLDCVLDWRRDHSKAEVARVVVRGNPLLAHRTDRPEISTGRELQVSVQHAVAAALVFGLAGIDQFTDD